MSQNRMPNQRTKPIQIEINGKKITKMELIWNWHLSEYDMRNVKMLSSVIGKMRCVCIFLPDLLLSTLNQQHAFYLHLADANKWKIIKIVFALIFFFVHDSSLVNLTLTRLSVSQMQLFQIGYQDSKNWQNHSWYHEEEKTGWITKVNEKKKVMRGKRFICVC